MVALAAAVVVITSIRPAVARQAAADGLDARVGRLVRTAVPSAACASARRYSLGLWAIANDKSPLDATATRRIYEEVLSRVLASRAKCVDVVDSTGVGMIMEHLLKSGDLEKSGDNVVAAVSQMHQGADILIFPSLYSQGGKILLDLRAVDRLSAKTVASAPGIPLPSDLVRENQTDASMPLDAAVKAASGTLLRSIPHLRVLDADGIYYEASEAQTPASRFIEDKVLASLVEQGSNVVTGATVHTRGISIEPASDKVEAKDLSEVGTNAQPGTFVLKGRYWVVGKDLDLRLSLRGLDGATASWRGHVRLSDLDGLETRPRNEAALQPPLPPAGYVFQATSTRGKGPTYRPGEALQLLLRASRPVWPWCFYVDSHGGVQAILPMAGSTQAKLLEADRLMRLPDPAKDRFELKINADTIGEELVSCFSTVRDVRRDLPSALFPDKPGPVPFLTLDKLRGMFHALEGAQSAESIVTVTVASQRVE